MELEIGKNEEKAKKILEDERCKKYTNMINSILRYNPHRLSDETEEVINMAGNAMTAYNTYKSIKLEYEPVIIDGKEYFEGISLTQKEFYEKLSQDADIATSQPSPESVLKLWGDLLAEYDEVVHIPMSSGLSGSCQGN